MLDVYSSWLGTAAANGIIKQKSRFPLNVQLFGALECKSGRLLQELDLVDVVSA